MKINEMVKGVSFENYLYKIIKIHDITEPPIQGTRFLLQRLTSQPSPSEE